MAEYDKEICLGHLYWNVGSLHIYDEDFKFLSDKTEIADEIKYTLSIVNNRLDKKFNKNIKLK